jgi:carbohydrate-selective porin OprB
MDDLDGKQETVRLTKLVFRPSWLEEAVLLSFGKLDPEDYFDRNVFAEDEETQFLTGSLLTNPMLKVPPHAPGATLRVKSGDWRYAFGVHAMDDVDRDMSGLPFIIGELGRRNLFPLSGHYRLWARVSAMQDDRKRVTWGTGVSIDQLLTSDIGLFVRAGVSRNQDESLTAHAWSVGLQFTPSRFGRGDDAFGVGYSEFRDVSGREQVAEMYYRLAATGWLGLSANVQWIISGPNAVTGGTNRNAVVPGFRALMSF